MFWFLFNNNNITNIPSLLILTFNQIIKKLINYCVSLYCHPGDLGREVEELVTVITEQEIEADEDDDETEPSEGSRKDHEVTITRV